MVTVWNWCNYHLFCDIINAYHLVGGIKLDEKKIIELYTKDKWTLRMIAEKFNTNHHRIKRVLVKNDVEITQKGRIRKPFTKEHREKISKATKGRKAWSEGKKMTRDHVIKNMVGHIKYDVDVEFYSE